MSEFEQKLNEMRNCMVVVAFHEIVSAHNAAIEVLESQRHAFRRDAMRWRMHQRMMGNRHSPASIREAREAVDAAIAAEEDR